MVAVDFMQMGTRGMLCLVLALGGCGSSRDGDDPVAVRPAKLIEIETANDERSLTLPVVIEAQASTKMTFQVGGLLSSLSVVGGQPIQQGDEVARLEQRDFANAVTQAQAQFDQAETAFGRADRLIKENAIARSVFDQRKTQLDVARAELDTARKRLEDSVLRAPFDGVIAQVPAKAYESVSPQETIAVIQSIGAAKAQAQIPATVVARSGQIEPLALQIVLDAAPEQAVPATLLSVDTRADPASQTFEAEFSFNPPEGVVILPGMTGVLDMTLRVSQKGVRGEQLMLPLEAILSAGSQQFVWLVDPDTMKVSKRTVEVGAGIGERIPIVSGLSTGDLVVGAGAPYLHEGVQVRRYEP